VLRLPIAASALVITLLLGATCGDPQDSSPSVGTPGATEPVPSITLTQSDAALTATATFDRVNEKRALNGLPTWAPGEVDYSLPNPYPTGAISTVTPGPSPTPQPANCGPEPRDALIEQYGELRNGCFMIFGLWILTTSGRGGQPGVLAVLQCPPEDVDCLEGKPPATGAAWEIFVAPRAGGVKVIGSIPPDQLIVNNGGSQMCFSLAAREYLTGECGEPVPVSCYW
jgi:hypothetical protein